MIPEDPALTFALTLKRWFASNGWPQKITDDWARATQSNSGPWASQVCNALKAKGYNPKAEFFLALAAFNKAVFEQEFTGITDRLLRDRLTGATALLLDNGEPFGGADFWSLYAGLLGPPEGLERIGEMTQEDVDAAMQLMRDNFRQICLEYMVNPPTAWQMVHAAIIEAADRLGVVVPPDDIQQFKEVLVGLFEHTPETLVPIIHRYGKRDPMVAAFHALLEDDAKKTLPIDLSKRGSALRSNDPSKTT